VRGRDMTGSEKDGFRLSLSSGVDIVKKADPK